MANVTVTNSSNNPISGNIGSEESWIAFYISVAICALMGLVSVFGNGLVVYISNKKKDSGKFRFVNRVVKHLALSDFLYGVIGIPCTIMFWLWGEYVNYRNNISKYLYTLNRDISKIFGGI